MMATPNSPAGTPASPLSERARQLIGSIVGGRYKVISRLGEGAMGEVFLVEHTVIRKRMALKILNDEMMKVAEAVARFEREALAAAHIEHPNVVAATDSGRTADGALFVVFEYVDGQSLHERIAQGPLPAQLALHITRQVVSALVRAHTLGIIHRDLKPENIMLVSRDGEDDIAKVLDFGLAKLSVQQVVEGTAATGRGDALTRFGAIFGTPAYMAPEQAAGGEVDGRTDLYAVGILLYEMLTGALPFDGDDPSTLLRQHLSAPVPPLKSRVPGHKVPPALEVMVHKLLEKQPDKRYESAKVLLDTVDALIKAQLIQSEAKTPSPSENQTIKAPDNLAARLLEELPPEERSESLMMAIQKLKGGAAPVKVSDETPAKPVIDPFAKTFTEKPVIEAPAKVPSETEAKEPSPSPAPAALTPAPQSPLITFGNTVKERYGKLLEKVRARLPEKRRGISQRVLGVAVGAVLMLPIVILFLVVFSSGDDAPAKGNGFASEREMEKAVRGDARDLTKLAAKYPNDSRVFRALTRAHVTRKDYVGAMRALSALARLDPTMASDDEMLKIATDAAATPESSDAAIALLESQLGDKGISALSDLSETAPDPLRNKMTASLQKGTTRALATEATIVLLDLRAAPRCEDKRTLLRRAGQQGDARTLTYLQGLQQMTTGCGTDGKSDCWGCIRKGTALKAAMDAISKRISG